jgi:hypothetical protein
MPSKGQLDQLCDSICKQVGCVLGSRRFEDWT